MLCRVITAQGSRREELLLGHSIPPQEEEEEEETTRGKTRIVCVLTKPKTTNHQREELKVNENRQDRP